MSRYQNINGAVSKLYSKSGFFSSPKPFIAILGVAKKNCVVKGALHRRWR
jgi:hypothetical protein